MPDEVRELQLEIAHILFIDIVGYSKLAIDDERALQQQLNQLVRSTETFRAAEAADKLVRLPTGDGMALVFFTDSETPVKCAVQIGEQLRHYPELKLRMGINSGPVSSVADVNDRANIAGAGINIAQRVMDLGDAGHILLSKRAAEDLEQYRRWGHSLHDLGEVEVKHGVKITVVNLYDKEIGNAQLPTKLKQQNRKRAARRRLRLSFVAAGLIAVASVPLVLTLWQRAHLFSPAELAKLPAKSIAVLPFANLSDDKQNAYFADGVQDEILTNLAKIADLKVISRTSVMQYKSDLKRNLRQIAAELSVAHVLEGSVQRAANRIRVNAQLIDARNDAHLWAQTFDRDLADVFAIQSEIASAIAAQLQAKLSAGEKAALVKPATTDLEAYDLYLRGNALYADTADPLHAREKLPQAADLLNRAVARDPQFMLAWYLLSRVHTLAYFQGHDHTPARLDLARAAVDSALRVQPQAGEAHLALADYYYHGFRDYPRARQELAIARQTLPNAAELFELTGYVDYRDGHWESAMRNLERAVELDPRNFHTIIQLALCYQPQRRYAEESRTYDRALSLIPDDPGIQMLKAQVSANWQADMKPFQTTFARLVAQNPKVAADIDDPFYALRERTPAAAARLLADYPQDGVEYYGVSYPLAYWQGLVAKWRGDTVKASAAFTVARLAIQRILEKQPEFPAALSLLGIIDAGLGRKEQAIREGRRACELLPMTKDAVDGVAFAVNLAQIYAWTGENELAIEQLQTVQKVPNDCHYGELRLHPIWDPLRGYAPFEQLVASMAPK